MKQCDIVVSATSAPHVVVKQEYYTPEKQVTFLDLATPRDIDPKLSDDSKVNLINLDTIKEISKVLNASLQRMIKEPIQELKHLETRQEQADYKKMVEQLFGIETKKGK